MNVWRIFLWNADYQDFQDKHRFASYPENHDYLRRLTAQLNRSDGRFIKKAPGRGSLNKAIAIYYNVFNTSFMLLTASALLLKSACSSSLRP